MHTDDPGRVKPGDDESFREDARYFKGVSIFRRFGGWVFISISKRQTATIQR
jgi:hypothetical protein